MKRIVATLLTICALASLCTGCSSASKKAAAIEAGKANAESHIQRVESETLDADNFDNNLGSKIAEKREENKEAHKLSNSSGGGSGVAGGEIVYIIDTLNNRVHKHNSGCTLLGAEDGRTTLENWTGTLDEAVAAGYTKCPECILHIGM